MQLDAEGLWTNPNPIGQKVPQGALRVADNITIDRPGVATPMRGFEEKSYSLPSGVSARKIFEYDGVLYVHGSNGTLYKDTGSAYVSVGSAQENTGWRMQQATAGGDLYVTGSGGIQVQDTTNGTLKTPGAPQALDAQGSLNVTDPNGWLVPNSAAAYRLVIGTNDAEGRPILGAPSGQFIVSVSGAGSTSTVTSTWPLPQGITTSHFVRLYRTTTVAGSSTSPGDTMGLVYEIPITSTDITNGYVQISDIAPDEMLGEPLYTNPDLGGQSASNVRPPSAHDVALFRNRLWAANTTGLQRLSLRMIATPSNGDVLTIAGQTFNATTSTGSPLSGDFFVLTTGTVAKNIEDTAHQLVNAINRKLTNAAVYAYYVSGPYDAPGQIIIERRSFASGAAFTAQASAHGDRYSPQLDNAVSSTADVFPNRLHYSVAGLHYAFPLGNTLAIGAQEKPILRAIPLRDSLFVFKQGDGLWKVSGVGPFYVEQFNATVQLLSPDAAVVVDNTIFALTDEGVIAVTESGVDVISVPVDNLFKDLLLQARSALSSLSFMVARDRATEKKVYVWLPESSSSTAATQALVWNQVTQTWTRSTRSASAGWTTQQGVLTLATPAAAAPLLSERRDGTAGDYRDLISRTFTVFGLGGAGDGTQAVTSPGVTNLLRVGQVVESSSSPGVYGRIVGLDNFFSMITVDKPIFALDDTATVYDPIHISVAWNTETASSPDTLKQFFETSVLFEENHTGPFPMTYTADGGASDYNPVLAEAEDTPYVRAEVPFDSQQTSRLGIQVDHDVCAEVLNIVGMSYRYRPLSGILTK